MNDTSHFSSDAEHQPTAVGRFVDARALDSVTILSGLEFRPVLGEQMMVNFVHFEPRTKAPKHVHLEEQLVVVLDGEVCFELDGEVRTLGPGDVAVVPPWVPHAAWTNDSSCEELDIFSPPRETLVAHARASQQRAAEEPPTGEGERPPMTTEA